MVAEILTWIVVGLCAGVWTAVFADNGEDNDDSQEIRQNLLYCIFGASALGALFRVANIEPPMAGLPGVSLVAAVGAAVFIVALRQQRRRVMSRH